MKRLIPTIFACLTAIALVTGCSSANNETAPPTQPTAPAENPGSKEPAQPPGPTGAKKYEKAPAMQIDKAKTYQAKISTTMGDITVDLFAKDAPVAVNNFVFLAKDKFYDGITFHRIIKDFMIQTGDPLGSGIGGPGYTFEDELNNGHTYEAGVVAMANAGPNTNGSQFFIGTGKDVEGLKNSPNYTIFGKVSGGMDVVQKIAGTKVKNNPQTGEQSTPEQTIKINSVTITEK
ncbi:peptidylprolyl isomerase [Brevibacillus choshinensis]|uniref:peptidylprolyl isomerase n=1 Tax=Brevibacillus choshinensis TaxID=54911 RepID=UPI002E1E905E|nr:peptidylprolyl isomerase [Brevibacillus choshinensis]MED4582211.1 peptidylprolyl isomerase [Brevibacillus choshinensis]MED4780866.1 peptidylprolyl isomerase [Brevibacillus choshinensis]